MQSKRVNMTQAKFYTILLLFLILGFFHAQSLKLKIVDSESGNPVPHARIILSNTVLYSNDDGFILLPENSNNLEVSASGYQTEKLGNYNSIIKLKPLYKDIEEVKIINVDIKKIFSDVLKNYEKRYYDQHSLYDIIYRKKIIAMIV